MKYVVFGCHVSLETLLHVEAASEAEATRIGEQHGLPSPIAIPLPEPIQMNQGTHQYAVFDRAKDEDPRTFLVISAASKEDAEGLGKEQGIKSPYATRLPRPIVLKGKA